MKTAKTATLFLLSLLVSFPFPILASNGNDIEQQIEQQIIRKSRSIAEDEVDFAFYEFHRRSQFYTANADREREEMKDAFLEAKQQIEEARRASLEYLKSRVVSLLEEESDSLQAEDVVGPLREDLESIKLRFYYRMGPLVFGLECQRWNLDRPISDISGGLRDVLGQSIDIVGNNKARLKMFLGSPEQPLIISHSFLILDPYMAYENIKKEYLFTTRPRSLLADREGGLLADREIPLVDTDEKLPFPNIVDLYSYVSASSEDPESGFFLHSITSLYSSLIDLALWTGCYYLNDSSLYYIREAVQFSSSMEKWLIEGGNRLPQERSEYIESVVREE